MYILLDSRGGNKSGFSLAYDYQKMIAQAWVSEYVVDDNVGAPTSTQSTTSIITDTDEYTSTYGTIHPRFRSASLHTLNRTLRGRLNHSSRCGH